MQDSKGFTLVELIIVIVVLSILAITALPQFLNFSSDAQISRLKGLEASLNSALDLVYSKATVKGLESAPHACLGGKLDDINISCPEGGTLLFYGYPAAKKSVLNEVLELDDWVVSEVGIGKVIGIAADTDDLMTCYVTYTEATAGNEPKVRAHTDSC